MPDEFVTPCINKDYLTLPYLTLPFKVRCALTRGKKGVRGATKEPPKMASRRGSKPFSTVLRKSVRFLRMT